MNDDKLIDKAATEGFCAAFKSISLLPMKYAGNLILSDAWHIGNRLGYAKANK